MKESQVRSLLSDIAPGKVQTKEAEWIMVACPFAPYGGRKSIQDRRVSFGVHIKDNGESAFNCFACHLLKDNLPN